MSLKLGYVPYGTGIIKPFDQVFDEAVNVLKHGYNDIDCLVIWGGGDISPSLYGHNLAPETHAGTEPGHRDIIEWEAVKEAVKRDIPIIGVCRGAQLLCAFAGGTLIQHVSNHHGEHMIKTHDNKSFMVTSIHHQMMYPFDVKHEMLGWTTFARSVVYKGNGGAPVSMMGKVEPEIVYFPSIRGLAIQGHPEYANEDSEFVQYCNTLVCSKLLNDVPTEC